MTGLDKGEGFNDEYEKTCEFYPLIDFFCLQILTNGVILCSYGDSHAVSGL